MTSEKDSIDAVITEILFGVDKTEEFDGTRWANIVFNTCKSKEMQIHAYYVATKISFTRREDLKNKIIDVFSPLFVAAKLDIKSGQKLFRFTSLAKGSDRQYRYTF
jgi:hypothetical protein